MRNNLYFIALFTFFFAIGLRGQSTYFNKMIEYNKETHFASQIESSDSALFTLNTVKEPAVNNTSIYLAKFNLNGDELWTKKFAEQNRNYNTERTLVVKDSLIYFLIQNTPLNTGISNEVMIKKLSLRGEELDTYHITMTDSVRIYHSALLEDGSFASTGFRRENDQDWFWFVNRIDTNGNELFYKEYQWLGRNLGRTISAAPDGGYVLAGISRGYNLDSLSQSTIIKTDSVGNIEWVQDFGDRWMDNYAYATVTKEGDIIASMQLNVDGDDSWPWDGLRKNQIVCLDNEGNIKWKRYNGITDEVFPTNARFPKQLSDGNIVVYSSERDLYAGTIGYIHKFTPEGDSIWTRHYRYLKNTWTDHYLRDVTELPNGNLAISGKFDPFGDTAVGTSAHRMWILGVDSLGCQFEGCDTACKKFDLEFTITHDSGYTYHVEILPPVINSYTLIKDNTQDVLDNPYDLSFDITFPGPGNYKFEFYGEDQCRIRASTDTVIQVEKPTQVEHINSDGLEPLSLFPNPANNTLHVKVPGTANASFTYQITTATGRQVQRGRLASESAIRLNGLAAGVYLLQVYNGSGALVGRERFVKE